MGGMLKVRVGASLSNPVTVTGVPNPTCCLKKDGDLSVKCQPDILQLDPAEESDHGRYSVVVSNCFNSDTESFVVDVLSKCWLVISVNVFDFILLFISSS